MKNNNLVLAIDTAISSGSFSLWRDGTEINSYIGTNKTSRSEDILSIIDNLLIDADCNKVDLTKVIFTNGPGSYTGLRVGVSTILGLCFSINCSFQAYSVLDVFIVATPSIGKLVTVVQTGREEVIYQEFQKGTENILKVNDPQKLKLKDFNNQIKYIDLDTVIVEKRLNNKIFVNSNTALIIASDNVANLLQRYSKTNIDKRKDNLLVLNYGGDFSV